MPKKIIISKNDGAEAVIIKLLKVKEDDITLVIPNFSQLSHSLDNFKLIKNEADEAGKKILIESVDDMVVELARRSDLEAVNPFFSEKKKKGKPMEPETASEKTPVAEVPLEELQEDIEEPLPHQRQRRPILLSLAVLIIIILPGFYVAYKVLPKATIEIITKKTDWDYTTSLSVDKTALAADSLSGKIPGQIFTERKNGQITYPATGKKKMSKKAAGTITIYNNFGSAPQPLVASTRFETPDGKIFRLVESVVVPGAKTSGGKLIASSVSAKVIADRGGEEYNIGPVEKFTIPGLRNSSKYNGFYGVSKEAMTSGFTGETAYPTDIDIKEAKAKSLQTIEDGLRLLIQNQLPQEFKIIPNSGKLSVLKQTVTTEVNEKNEFSVFVDAELNIMAFRESDVLSVVNEQIKKELINDLKPKTFSLQYNETVFDSAKGIMTLPLTFKSQLEHPVNVDNLKKQIVGKSELELKALLFSMPGLASVDIKLWPLWVRRVPESVDMNVK